MLGMAQRLFFDRCHKKPWKAYPYKQTTNWPLLEKLLENKSLHYVDFALAQKLLQSFQTQSEAAAAFICHISLAARQGHLCCTITSNEMIPSPEEIWTSKDNSSIQNSPETWQELRSLIWKGTKELDSLIPIPIYKFHDRYYLQKLWAQETQFINGVRLLLSEDTPRLTLDMNRVLSTVNQMIKDKKLLPEQADAIIHGCKSLLTIIIGGPGTGKTYTAGQLLSVFWNGLSKEQQAKCKIRLAAPTGKAALNLESSIQHACNKIEGFPTLSGQTLHMLIKANSFSQSTLRLDADILLVDECSMIDVNMMGKLMSALKPGARLILLGDPHQLPAVESGAVFADLVRHLQSSEKHTYVVELKKCLRAELKSIVELANHINSGNISTVCQSLQKGFSKGISYKTVDWSITPAKTQRVILEYAFSNFPSINVIPENPLEILDAFNRYRILTPLRQGPFGTDQLNALFYKEILAKASQRECVALPIMITRNNYRLGLFNGEIGLLIKFKYHKENDFALFTSKSSKEEARRIPALMLPDYEFAYCISIHKSQGSEFDHIMILLPDGSDNFGREALYTGITRARHSLEIWGDDLILQKMIQKMVARHSSVGLRLGRLA